MGGHHSKVTVVQAGGIDLSPTDAPLPNKLRSEYANATQRASGRVAWDLQEYEYRSKERDSDEVLLVDKETARISHGNTSPSGAGALPTCGPSDKRIQGQAASYHSSAEKACGLEAGAKAPVLPASAGRTARDKNGVTPAAPCTQTDCTAAGLCGENSSTAGSVSKRRRPATGNPNHHSNNKQSAAKAHMTGSHPAVPPARAACAATAAPATAVDAQNAATGTMDIKTYTATPVAQQTDTVGKAAGTTVAPAAAAPDPDSTSAASMADAAAAAAAACVQWVIRPGPAIESVYKLGKILGQGSFGVVRAATHLATGAEVAVKTIRKSMLRAADVTSLRREVEILHHLSGHPHISQLLGVYEELRQLHLVLELYKGGDLFDAIIGSGRHSERTAADVLRTVLTAIAYCHAMGVAHRDIKPENFMLTAELPKDFQDKQGPPLPPQQQPQQQQQGPGGRLVAPLAPPLIGIGARLKLIDFGLSAFCTDDTPMTDIVGTSYYVAPEVLEGRYGLPADVWSVGVILHIMLTGYAPFDGKDDREILRAVRKGHLDLSKDPIWKSISPEATAVLTAMLDRDPQKRATADQVLSMPWIGRTTDACLAPSTPLPGLVSERMHRFARMSSFKKEARRVVAGLMRPEEVAGLVAQFQGLDADKDGRVNLVELREGLARQAALRGGKSASTAALLSEEQLRELLRRSDLNGDGLLDESEFLAAALPSAALARHALAMTAAAAGPRPPSRHGQQSSNALAEAFKHFDVDGSGYITLSEMRKALAAHHSIGESADIEALLARHDQDADGRISYPEFVDMLVQDIDDEDDNGGSFYDEALHSRPQRQARGTPPVSGNISPSTKCGADSDGGGGGGSADGRNRAPHSKDNAVAWGTGGFEPCSGGGVGGGVGGGGTIPGASKGRGDGASATFSRSSTVAAQTAGSRLSALEWMDECSDGTAAAAVRHEAVEEAVASKPSDALGMVTTPAAAVAAQAAARRSGNGGAPGIAATSTSAPRIPSRLSHTQVPHIPLQQSPVAPRESPASGGMPRLAIRCGSGGANRRTSVGGYSPSAADAADPGSGGLYRLADAPSFAGGQAVAYGGGGIVPAVQAPAPPPAHRMTPPRLQLPIQPTADVRSRRHSAGGMMPDGRGLFVVVGGSGVGGAGGSGTGSGAASPLSHGDSRPAAHIVRQIPGGRTSGASIDLGLGYNLNDLPAAAAARAAVTGGDGCAVSLPGSPSAAAASTAAQRVVAGRVSVTGSGAVMGPPAAVLQQRPPALQPLQPSYPGPMGMLPTLQTQLSNSPGERLSEHASCPQTPLAGWPLSPGGGGAAAATTRQSRASATGMFAVRNPPPWAATVNATLRPAPPSEPLPVLHISGMRSRRQSTGSPALCQVTVSGATAAIGVASPQAQQAQPQQHLLHAHAQHHYSVTCNSGGGGCNSNSNSNNTLSPRVIAPIMSDWASGGASSAGTPTTGRRSRRITQPGILPLGEELILTSPASMDLDGPTAGAVDDASMNHHVLPPGATGLGFGAPYRPLMTSGSGRLL